MYIHTQIDLNCLRIESDKREGDWMKIADHLNRDTKDKLNHISKPNKKVKKRKRSSKKKEERIDWHDIMGTNRQTLKRSKGGAMRRK